MPQQNSPRRPTVLMLKVIHLSVTDEVAHGERRHGESLLLRPLVSPPVLVGRSDAETALPGVLEHLGLDPATVHDELLVITLTRDSLIVKEHRPYGRPRQVRVLVDGADLRQPAPGELDTFTSIGLLTPSPVVIELRRLVTSRTAPAVRLVFEAGPREPRIGTLDPALTGAARLVREHWFLPRLAAGTQQAHLICHVADWLENIDVTFARREDVLRQHLRALGYTGDLGTAVRDTVRVLVGDVGRAAGGAGTVSRFWGDTDVHTTEWNRALRALEVSELYLSPETPTGGERGHRASKSLPHFAAMTEQLLRYGVVKAEDYMPVVDAGVI